MDYEDSHRPPLIADHEDSRRPQMKFICVQTLCFFVLFINPYFLYSAPSHHLVSSLYHAPKNPCSHQHTSVPVYVFPAPLYVLGVCGVGYIPIASAITPISSLLSVISACHLILTVSEPVSLPSTALTMLLLSLTSVSEVSTLSAALPLPGEISTLVSRPTVVKKTDVIRSCMPVEGCVISGSVAEAFPFRLKLDSDFYVICSLWKCDAIPVGFT